MPSLKEVRNRITSVSSTMQITSAMKMVSAAKLKKAQDAIVQMRPYSQKLSEILGNLSKSVDTSENPFAEERGTEKVLVVAITSNRGLCGAFNANIAKGVRHFQAEHTASNISVLPIGKKAFDAFKKSGSLCESPNLPADGNYLFDNLTFENVSELAEKLMLAFTEGEFDKVVLVYNRFKNAATQIVTTEQFLPVVTEVDTESNGSSTDYFFEPSKEEILGEIIPKSLKTQLFKALLDSFASEHGARMTAMHKATDNATDLIKELKLTYNKARQASITKEILEIVGGAEALNN